MRQNYQEMKFCSDWQDLWALGFHSRLSWRVPEWGICSVYMRARDWPRRLGQGGEERQLSCSLSRVIHIQTLDRKLKASGRRVEHFSWPGVTGLDRFLNGVLTSFSGGTGSSDSGCRLSPCSWASVPLFRKSAGYLQLSEPRSSFCCFAISSISLELFLLNTPGGQKGEVWAVTLSRHWTSQNKRRRRRSIGNREAREK